MDIPELERRLLLAQTRLNELLQPLKEVKDAMRAFEAVAVAQRELAAAKGEEHAIPLDLGFYPDAAVSEACLIQSECRTVLAFRALGEHADGMRYDVGFAIIEFESCGVTKFGYPNDEALPGHPLYSKGLCGYGAYEVPNSLWIKVQTEQNRVPFPATPDSTDKHFIFTFHDSTFECIAEGFRAALSTGSFEKILVEITNRVFLRE